MEAFVVKILSFLLIIALMTSSVEAKRSHKENKNVMTSSVEAKRSHKENKNGNNGRTFGTKNSTADDDNQHVTGFRRMVQPQAVFIPNPPANPPVCYTQFFVNRQPPQGLRNNLQNIRYICQPTDQQTYYATMFDEGLGIALFSAYKMTQAADLTFVARRGRRWAQTGGIVRQGSNQIYRQQPDRYLNGVAYHKGHLVPGNTFSSTPQRHRSTFKYTNAVPQHAVFNSGQWAQFEWRIRMYAERCILLLNGELYLLTGTTSFVYYQPANNPPLAHVPVNRLRRLPEYRDQNNILHPAIRIPNSMWTAGCCVVAPNPQNPQNTGNFAVIGNNVENTNEIPTQQVTVRNLQAILEADVGQNGLNNGGPNVNLFPIDADCSDPARNVKLPEAKAKANVQAKHKPIPIINKAIAKNKNKNKNKNKPKANAKAQSKLPKANLAQKKLAQKKLAQKKLTQKKLTQKKLPQAKGKAKAQKGGYRK